MNHFWLSRLPWRDRLKALGLILLLLAALYWLAGCGGELPEQPPDTQPMAARYTLFVPFARHDYAYEGGKAGVGIATQASAVARPNHAADIGAGWWYNWSLHPDLAGLPEQVGAEFVPMVWRGSADELAALECPPTGAPLFWLNEPNEPGQAVTSPTAAVDLLEQLSAVCPETRLIGPHMAPRDRHSGWPWAVAFYQEWERRHGAAPPTVLALHLYDHPAAFTPTIDGYYRALARWVDADAPIWITEFNVPCGDKSAAEIAPLLAQATRILDEDGRVERYAVFALHNGGRWPGLECGEMVDERGQLTAVGRAYRDAATAAYP